MTWPRRLVPRFQLRPRAAFLFVIAAVAWLIVAGCGAGVRGREWGRWAGWPELQPRYPADPGGQVLQVSRARRQQRKGKLRLDNARTRGRRRLREAWRSCRASSRRASSTSASRRRIADERMPPPKSGKSLSAGRDRQAQALDRGRGRVRRALGVHAAGRPALAGGQERGLVPQSDRLLHPGQARSRGARALARGRQGRRCSGGSPRPDRSAADDRRGRCVSGRSARRCLRQTGRAAARFAALRRALGPDLARRRALRRFRRLRERQVAPGVLLPRLGRSAP